MALAPSCLEGQGSRLLKRQVSLQTGLESSASVPSVEVPEESLAWMFGGEGASRDTGRAVGTSSVQEVDAPSSGFVQVLRMVGTSSRQGEGVGATSGSVRVPRMTGLEAFAAVVVAGRLGTVFVACLSCTCSLTDMKWLASNHTRGLLGSSCPRYPSSV